jgi:hypothetical protein
MNEALFCLLSCRRARESCQSRQLALRDRGLAKAHEYYRSFFTITVFNRTRLNGVARTMASRKNVKLKRLVTIFKPLDIITIALHRTHPNFDGTVIDY